MLPLILVFLPGAGGGSMSETDSSSGLSDKELDEDSIVDEDDHDNLMAELCTIITSEFFTNIFMAKLCIALSTSEFFTNIYCSESWKQ